MKSSLFVAVGTAVGSTLLFAGLLNAPWLRAQSPSPAPGATGAAFDVVSIKPNNSGPGSFVEFRTLPDGGYTMVNSPIRSIILQASPVPSREVVGLPDWATKDSYDVTVKPPAGSTPEQLREMWRNMFAERMKLVAHIEEHEQSTFALVLARSDGRLGPQLKRSTLDCSPLVPGATPAPPPTAPVDPANRCGGGVGRSSIVSGGMAMDQFALRLAGVAGAQVFDRTGLDGWYAFTLRFTRPNDPAPVDDAPDIFTALQEQLGLKLQAEKTQVPVLVVDHIERPTPN